MSTNTQITAAEWLAIRTVVADALQVSGSQQQKPTRERIAEKLISAGYIDIEHIQAELNRRRVHAEGNPDAVESDSQKQEDAL